jgi:hypothetical protein
MNDDYFDRVERQLRARTKTRAHLGAWARLKDLLGVRPWHGRSSVLITTLASLGFAVTLAAPERNAPRYRIPHGRAIPGCV